MSDETDTTSEVARVLGEHYPDQTSYDAGDLHGCMGCGWEVPRPRSNDTGDWEAYWAHQAAMLAEAGLLRDSDLRLTVTERLGQPTHVRIERSGVLIMNGYIEGPRAMRMHPQITTQEPAGGTQGGSGDSRASGGLAGAAVSAEDAALIEGANQAMIRLGLRPLTLEEIAERFGKDAP